MLAVIQNILCSGTKKSKRVYIKCYRIIVFSCLSAAIFEFVWKAIVKLSSNAYTGYIDIIYSNAVLGKRNWLDLVSIVYFFIFFYCVVFALTILIRRKLRTIADGKKMANMTDDERITYNEKKSANPRAVTIIENHPKKIIAFTYLSELFFLFAFAQSIFTGFIDLQLNASFSQRCDVIAPYVDEQEEQILRSKWASMKSRKDYENINQYSEGLAKSKNVNLPKPLLE
jgi:hypothetical protein